MDVDLVWLWQGVLAVSLVIAISANGLALIVFCARPSLRTISNRFVMNLVCSNLWCACTLGPLLAADLSGMQAPALCSLAELAAAAGPPAAALSGLLVAADQYLAVTDPLRYRSRLSRARSLLAILVQWLLAIVLAMPSAVKTPNNSVWSFCKTTQTNNKVDVFKIIHSVIYLTVVALSLAAISLMYWRISSAARKSAKPPAPPPALIISVEEGEDLIAKAKALSVRDLLSDVNRPFPTSLCLKFTHEATKKGLSHDDIYKMNVPAPEPALKAVRSSPDLGAAALLPQRRSSSSYVTSLRCRISNASLFRYREESRAARVSSLVIVLALVSQLPAAVTLATPALGLTPLFALVVASAVSPFLFVFRSRRIKNELGGMLKRRRPSEESSPSSWKGGATDSSRTALRLLRALAAEGQPKEGALLLGGLGCPPGKSILKKVRDQSRRWGRPQRCKFSEVPPPPR